MHAMDGITHRRGQIGSLSFMVGILGLLWWFLGSDDPKRRSWGILSLSLSFLMCTYVHGPTYLSGMLLFAAGWADDTT